MAGVDSHCVALPGDAAAQRGLSEGWLATPKLDASVAKSTVARFASYGRHPSPETRAKGGAGNGIRTRDFDLGKVALYH